MEAIKNFLSYIFTISPGTIFNYYLPFAILIALLIIGGSLFNLYYKKKKKEDIAFKKLFKPFGNRLITYGVILGILILARYERIPYFSMRIWLFLICLLLTISLFKYIKIWRLQYPQEKEKIQSRKANKAKKKSKKKYTTSKK